MDCVERILVRRLDSHTATSGQLLKTVRPASIAANKPFVDRITELAERKNATTAQLSLSWLLAKNAFIVPIPGTGKVKRLQENIESTKLVLTAEDMKEIDSVLAKFKVHGGRMNEDQMKVVEQ